ncbi:MAG TPA: asparaginase [Planctomycetes bacterium]|nr:asparaginase [Planctomycetota bacterium]
MSAYPENPVLVHVERAGIVESIHRGAWCFVDVDGKELAGSGHAEHPYFVRSSIKSIQALPLVETGAAERFAFSEEELAMAMASHSGEACHTETVAKTLQRLGLSEADLKCGAHPPNDPEVRYALRLGGGKPNALHNNCSGKHVGFLALAKHLGVPVENYLDPESEGQVLVRRAISDLSGVPESELIPGIDGCSAPTYRLPLVALGRAFARVTTPDGLAPERAACFRNMVDAAANHPVLIAGSHRRIDTDILRATRGRLFPKIGAEGIHAVGVRGEGRAIALKVDDGGLRALGAIVSALLEHLELLRGDEEREALAPWRGGVLRNYAGREVGRVSVVLS